MLRLIYLTGQFFCLRPTPINSEQRKYYVLLLTTLLILIDILTILLLGQQLIYITSMAYLRIEQYTDKKMDMATLQYNTLSFAPSKKAPQGRARTTPVRRGAFAKEPDSQAFDSSIASRLLVTCCSLDQSSPAGALELERHLAQRRLLRSFE